MSASLLTCLVREQRRVNAAEHNPGTACSRHLADRVAAQRIPCVNADADHVSGRHVRGVDGIQRFVDDVGISPPNAGGRSQHVQPSRGDDGDAERHVARVDQMDTGLVTDPLGRARRATGVCDGFATCHVAGQAVRQAHSRSVSLCPPQSHVERRRPSCNRRRPWVGSLASVVPFVARRARRTGTPPSGAEDGSPCTCAEDVEGCGQKADDRVSIHAAQRASEEESTP